MIIIRDKGNIKWTAMMLSEHVAELRRRQNEEHYEEHYEERPGLDDFDFQAIQYEIEVA